MANRKMSGQHLVAKRQFLHLDQTLEVDLGIIFAGVGNKSMRKLKETTRTHQVSEFAEEFSPGRVFAAYGNVAGKVENIEESDLLSTPKVIHA